MFTKNAESIAESIFILEEEIKFYEYQLKRGSTFMNYAKLIEQTRIDLSYLYDSLDIFGDKEPEPSETELDEAFAQWELMKRKDKKRILA
jgi:hypothetical protein